MDFVLGLPWTQRQYDSIWVVVERFTKSAPFIPVKSTYSAKDYSRIFIDEILFRQVIPLSIISYRSAQFTFRFLRSFQKGLATKVKLSIAFHPQMDGQAKRTMIRSCIIHFKRNWDKHLPLVELNYNNSFNSSISMAPDEARYGRRCWSPI